MLSEEEPSVQSEVNTHIVSGSFLIQADVRRQKVMKGWITIDLRLNRI